MPSSLLTHLTMSAEGAARLAADHAAAEILHGMAARIAAVLRAGGKLLLAGNGGSAADAQHIAAEFVSRLLFDRAPLAALALTESGPILTACGNDYGFASVFARQVAALGRDGDVFWGFSTSGNSANLLEAGQAAHDRGMTTLGFAGRDGGAMAGRFDHLFRAPSSHAQVVQQLHMVAAHAVLAEVEHAMFADGPG